MHQVGDFSLPCANRPDKNILLGEPRGPGYPLGSLTSATERVSCADKPRSPFSSFLAQRLSGFPSRQARGGEFAAPKFCREAEVVEVVESVAHPRRPAGIDRGRTREPFTGR